jgi:hypothetical protein
MLGPVLSTIAQFNQSTFNPDSSVELAREELAVNEARLIDIEKRSTRLLDVMEEAGHSSLVLERLQSLEKERSGVESTNARIRATLEQVPLLGAEFGKELAAAAAVVVADKTNVDGRHKNFMIHLRNGDCCWVNPGSHWLGRAKNRNAGKARNPV